MNIASDSPRPSVMERIARVRARMRVEKNSGIAVAEKEAFLAQCLRSQTSHEHTLRDRVSLAKDWPDDWDDWADRNISNSWSDDWPDWEDA